MLPPNTITTYKHLMTGPTGNTEFLSVRRDPQTLKVSVSIVLILPTLNLSFENLVIDQGKLYH